MRLFVRSKNRPDKKIYLKINVNSRQELEGKIGSRYFLIDGIEYSVNDVYAEGVNDSAITGALIGGVIGLLGGPAGVAIGATAGGILGNQNDTKDNFKVKNFNHRKI